MRGIILDEEFQATLAVFFGGVAAQGARDQRWCALADKAENLFVRQGISSHIGEGGVDRKGQVEFGIDQRAVQIEDQRADFGETGDGVPQWSLTRRSVAKHTRFFIRSASEPRVAAEILRLQRQTGRSPSY